MGYAHRAYGFKNTLGHRNRSIWSCVGRNERKLLTSVACHLVASPGDIAREQGGNPFFDEQVPQAVIALKQGVGRLIRDETDCGVVMLCDTRLVTKGYGRQFISSLPPMRRTRALEDVQAFLRAKLG